MANYDNRATVTFCGEKVELLASNGACVIYAEQFQGDKGTSGRLKQEILNVYNALFTVGAYEDRENEDGSVSLVQKRTVDYDDVPSIIGVTWAMARAAGSTRLGYEKFREKFLRATSDYRECNQLVDDLIFDLAQRSFFRVQEGPDDAGQPDEG